MPKTKKSQLPAYLTEIYGWLYLKPKRYNFLDNPYLLNTLTLGSHYFLTEEVRKEISTQCDVLQLGVNMGSLTEKAYSTLGALGTYTLIDVIPEMIENCREKHLEHNINYIQENAAKSIKGEYDIIICYMLLHELPPITRSNILKNMLKALKPGGKVIFIDYHQPSSYNPLKYFIRMFNRLYQPFAEALWKQSIKDMVPNAETCHWSQQTYYGGMYQKVVATKNH